MIGKMHFKYKGRIFPQFVGEPVDQFHNVLRDTTPELCVRFPHIAKV